MYKTNRKSYRSLKGLITSHIVNIETEINYYHFLSIAILLGLFVNFIFNLNLIFNTSTKDNFFSLKNLYIFSYTADTILFIIIFMKYATFLNRLRMIKFKYLDKNLVSNNVIKYQICQMLNEYEYIISNFCKDISRYILIILFLCVLFINTWLRLNEPLSYKIIRQFCLGVVSIYIALVFCFEWPTILLWRSLKQYTKPSLATKSMNLVQDG